MNSEFRAPQESELRRFLGIAQQLSSGRPAFGSGQRPADRTAGSGLEFKDYREYQPGEDSSRIDWRASNRSNHTLVRRYHNEMAASWVICLDDSASMSTPSSAKWLLASQVASAFAYLLLHAGHQCALVRFSDRIDHYVPGAAGHAHYLRILNELRNQTPRSNGGGTTLNSLDTLVPDSAHVAVFSDCLVPQGMQAELLAMARPGRRFRLVQILSTDETELPGDTTLQLEDSESGVTRISAPQQQAQAQASLHTLCQSLSEFCRRTQIPFTQCTTSHTWQHVLQQQHKACAGV